MATTKEIIERIQTAMIDPKVKIAIRPHSLLQLLAVYPAGQIPKDLVRYAIACKTATVVTLSREVAELLIDTVEETLRVLAAASSEKSGALSTKDGGQEGSDTKNPSASASTLSTAPSATSSPNETKKTDK